MPPVVVVAAALAAAAVVVVVVADAVYLAGEAVAGARSVQSSRC